MRVRIPATIKATRYGDGWWVTQGFHGYDGPYVSKRLAQAHADRYNRAHPQLVRCPVCHGTGSVEKVDARIIAVGKSEQPHA